MGRVAVASLSPQLGSSAAHQAAECSGRVVHDRVAFSIFSPSEMLSRIRQLLDCLVLCGLVLTSCGSPHKQPSTSAQPSSDLALDFAFPGLDGVAVSSQSTRGRVTVLLFVTTFDLASQLSAKRLEDLYRSHAPRINSAAIVVEAPRYAELARSFAENLELSYPVALADRTLLDAHPQLSAVEAVPAWIFLDQGGKVHSSAVGAMSLENLQAAVEAAQ